MYAHYLGLCFRIAEDKIAKSHVLFHHLSKVERHLLRVLIHKSETLSFCLLPIFCFCTLHYQWYIWVTAMYVAQQFQSGFAILYASYGESYIANNAQHIVGKLVVQSHSFLVVACQYHLRTTTHTQRGSMSV